MTSRELADIVMEENTPCDYGWIRYVFRSEGFKGLREIAKSTTECFAPQNTSKQLIWRASTIVARELYSFVR